MIKSALNVECVLLGCSGIMNYFIRLRDMETKVYKKTPESDFRFDSLEMNVDLSLKYNSLLRDKNTNKFYLDYFYKLRGPYWNNKGNLELLKKEDNKVTGTLFLDNIKEEYYFVSDEKYKICCEDIGLCIIDPNVVFNTETKKIERLTNA